MCKPFADPEHGWVNHMVNKGQIHEVVFSCDDGYCGVLCMLCNVVSSDYPVCMLCAWLPRGLL